MAKHIVHIGRLPIDMAGQRCGDWLVLRQAKSRHKTAYWWCRCKCGREKAINSTSLRAGDSTGCGCGMVERIRARRTIRRTGNRYGMLTALRVVSVDGRGRGTYWLCRCDCGNEKPILATCLGYTLSCGCLRVTNAGNRTHGRSKTPTYRIWAGMIQRCHGSRRAANAKYIDAGVRVCQRWRADYAAFVADLGERPSPAHTLDRKENAHGYDCGRCDDCRARGASPNCQWSTIKQQSRNRRSTQMITWRGETRPAIEWQERTGILSTTLLDRVKNGWPMDRAMTEKPRRGGRPRATLASRLKTLLDQITVMFGGRAQAVEEMARAVEMLRPPAG